MSKTDAKKVTKSDLVRVLKLSRTTVQKYLLQDGAPKPDPKTGYDVAAVRNYIAEHGSGNVEGSEVNQLRAQKQRLEIEEMEDARLLRRGELVKKSQIAPAVAAYNAGLTADLRQKFEIELPGKYKGRGMVECQQMNAEAIDWVLKRLKEGQWALGLKEGG
jgi:hypothetical protein